MLEPQLQVLVDRRPEPPYPKDVHGQALVTVARGARDGAQALAHPLCRKVREHEQRAKRAVLVMRAARRAPRLRERRDDRGVRLVLAGRRPGSCHEGWAGKVGVRERGGQPALEDRVAVAVGAADPPLRAQSHRSLEPCGAQLLEQQPAKRGQIVGARPAHGSNTPGQSHASMST